jgi:tetratricopeptide (TPR) repeat protein
LSDDRHLWEGAAVAYDQARLLGLPPRMLWYQFGPYEAYLAVGRHDDVRALAEATLATQGGRNVEETYLHLGRALAALGDHAGASAAWRRVVELHPAGPAGRAAAERLAAGN